MKNSTINHHDDVNSQSFTICLARFQLIDHTLKSELTQCIGCIPTRTSFKTGGASHHRQPGLGARTLKAKGTFESHLENHGGSSRRFAAPMMHVGHSVVTDQMHV